MPGAALSLQYDNTGAVTENTNIIVNQTPTVGTPTPITVTVYNVGDGPSTLTQIFGYVCPGGVAGNTPWEDIIANPMSPTGSVTSFVVIPAQSGDTPGSAAIAGLTWTPAESGHVCLIVTAAANGIPFNPGDTTPWSDIYNDPQVAWHNETVLPVAASPDPAIPPIILVASFAADATSVQSRTIRVPLHADPAATRNATLVARRAPASPNASAPDSPSTFPLNVDESSGEQGAIGSYVTDIVHMEITVPTDVVAGTQAAFDLTTERDGVMLNGYRVVLKFV
jgi:hypothetical protein